MNLTALEQQYQTLRRDFEAGQIDEATFMNSIDQLGFQDRWGRYWLIGAQSGAWYYYDPQTARWQQADPHQVTPLLINKPGYSRKWTTSAASMLVTGFICLILLTLLVWPASGASRINEPTLSLLPTPTFAILGGSRENGSKSSISGLVTDLSSGQPGAAIEVSVSGAIVRTDTDGSYSITGLPAGAYTVSPQLHDQGMPAQGPIFVNVDGQNSVIVDLAYYSQAQPLPTDTPQAAIAVPLPTPLPAATPPALPAAGAPISSRPLVIAGLGLLLIGGGLLLRKS